MSMPHTILPTRATGFLCFSFHCSSILQLICAFSARTYYKGDLSEQLWSMWIEGHSNRYKTVTVSADIKRRSMHLE